MLTASFTAAPTEQDKQWKPTFGKWEERELSFFRYYDQPDAVQNDWYCIVGTLLHDLGSRLPSGRSGKMDDALLVSDALGKRYSISVELRDHPATADCNGWTGCRFRIALQKNEDTVVWISGSPASWNIR